MKGNDTLNEFNDDARGGARETETHTLIACRYTDHLLTRIEASLQRVDLLVELSEFESDELFSELLSVRPGDGDVLSSRHQGVDTLVCTCTHDAQSHTEVRG